MSRTLVVLPFLLAACAGSPSPAAEQPSAAPTESHAAASHDASDTGSGAGAGGNAGDEYGDLGGSSGGAGGGAGATGTNVVLTAFAFDTQTLTVPAGTTVTFRNEDGEAHTVTEGSNGTAADGARFDEDVGPGGTTEVTFDEAGTVEVTCRIHPNMNMTVVVEG